MVTIEQLRAATAAENAWREANVHHRPLNSRQQAEWSLRQQAELKQLAAETLRISRELLNQEFALVTVPDPVLASDADSVTLKLPRDVLELLLICHEGGLTPQEQLDLIPPDDADGLRILKTIETLAANTRL